MTEATAITTMKKMLAPAFQLFIGRRNLARLAHYLLDYARLDSSNDPTSNGELLIQRSLPHLAVGMSAPVIFDVGARVGDWTVSAAKACASVKGLRVYSFEPCSSTFVQLEQACASIPKTISANPCRLALSNLDGTAELA